VLLSGLIGSVVGGLLSCVGSFFGVRLTQKMNNALDKQRYDKTVTNVLKAIHDEISSIYTSYMETIGNFFDKIPDDGTLDIVFTAENDYFTVYKANAHLLGNIDDDTTRGLFINTYSACMSLHDRYNVNNAIHKLIFDSLRVGPSGMNLAARERNLLPSAFKSILEKHNEVKSLYSKLMQALAARGISNNK
jgi:hypothetical protein